YPGFERAKEVIFFASPVSEPRKIPLALLSVAIVKVSATNRKCSASGKKTGQRCETIFVASKILSVSGATLLPSAFTFHNHPDACGENTITPRRLQLPPRPLVAVARACGAPPETATF